MVEEYPATLKFNRYIFEKLLGKGGQGEVCLYKDKEHEKHVAIKFDKEGESLILEECLFLKEYYTQLKLAVRYYMHDTVKARRFMVMEYLEDSVEEYMIRFRNDVDKYFEAVKTLSLQMFDSIEELHAANHIHRNIKTENFRMKGYQLYLTDFGLVTSYLDKDSQNHIQQLDN